jgi:hypothetical protein
MKVVYWPWLASTAAFLIWASTHTDELPVVLGLVLLSGALLAAIFPRMSAVTALVIGACVFIAETLVHFAVLRAPYPASSGIPWVALLGYIPAIMGVGIGVSVRKLSAA